MDSQGSTVSFWWGGGGETGVAGGEGGMGGTNDTCLKINFIAYIRRRPMHGALGLEASGDKTGNRDEPCTTPGRRFWVDSALLQGAAFMAAAASSVARLHV